MSGCFQNIVLTGCHIYCVVFMAQISVSASYFVSTLLNARCSSFFCKTFHVGYVSFNLLLHVFARSGLDLAVGLQAAWQYKTLGMRHTDDCHDIS